MMRAWAVCALAVAGDARLFHLALDLPLSANYIGAVWAGHATACVMFAIGAIRLLPDRLRRPPLASCSFILSSTFFVPVLGMIGVLTCVIPALHVQRRLADPCVRPPQPRHDANAPPPPAGQVSHLQRRSELLGVLKHAADPSNRTDALITTLFLDDEHAVPLLRLTLKDADDEIRLLAFALLNRRETAIEARMRERERAEVGMEGDREFLRHKALAHDFWELARLGAPRGSTLMSLCESALVHAQTALQSRPQDGGLQFLLGRILLTQRRLDAAGVALERACQLGIDARHCKQLLAEIAFRKQRTGAAGFIGASIDAAPGHAALGTTP